MVTDTVLQLLHCLHLGHSSTYTVDVVGQQSVAQGISTVVMAMKSGQTKLDLVGQEHTDFATKKSVC